MAIRESQHCSALDDFSLEYLPWVPIVVSLGLYMLVLLVLQIMAADDIPLREVHNSPCQGLVLRGRNRLRPATMDSRLKH